MKTPSPLFACALTALLLPSTALAGRPLVVDDANVNEPGKGQVEMWLARQPGKVNTWSVAPAYAPIEGLELGATLSRDTTAHASSTAIQAKWRITPSNDEGCNVGAVLGVSHAQGNGNTPYLNGLATCNMGEASAHFNLGATRAPGGPTLPTWGLAWEQPLGPVTAHIETFGQRHAKPSLQVGLRAEIAKGLQLDGTLGRMGRDTVFSLDTKISF